MKIGDISADNWRERKSITKFMGESEGDPGRLYMLVCLGPTTEIAEKMVA